MRSLFCDCKTDEEKSTFFLSGRAVETGIIAAAISNDVAMAYHRCSEFKKEIDALHAKIEAMEKQEPIYLFRRKGLDDFCTCSKERYEAFSANPRLFEVKTLYALPGAQNVPEKLCYDSRWEISIDYVDGWNAAVDMMRGKSPSWHCPDCCIAFPFGAPKSCPNDDARCNSLLAAAPETKP